MIKQGAAGEIVTFLTEEFLGETNLRETTEVEGVIGNYALLAELANDHPELLTALLHFGNRALGGIKANVRERSKQEIIGVLPGLIEAVASAGLIESKGELYKDLKKNKELVPNKDYFVSVNFVGVLKDLVDLLPRE